MKLKNVFILIFCLMAFTAFSQNDRINKTRRNVEFLYKDVIAKRTTQGGAVLKLYPVPTDTTGYFNVHNSHWKIFDPNSRVAKDFLDYDIRDSSSLVLMIDRGLLIDGLGLDTLTGQGLDIDTRWWNPVQVEGDLVIEVIRFPDSAILDTITIVGVFDRNHGRNGNQTTGDFIEWGEPTRVIGNSDFIRNTNVNLTSSYFYKLWSTVDTALFTVDGLSGRVGMGLGTTALRATGGQKLTVRGAINLNSASNNNTLVGFWDASRPLPTGISESALFGYAAGRLNINQTRNTAQGYEALSATTGTNNSNATGYHSIYLAGGTNTEINAYGNRAGEGINNTSNGQFFGGSAGRDCDDCSEVQGIGGNTLLNGDRITESFAAGNGALGSASNDHSRLVVIGDNAASNSDSSSNTVIIGPDAGLNHRNIDQSFILGAENSRNAKDQLRILAIGPQGNENSENNNYVSYISSENGGRNSQFNNNLSGIGRRVLQGATKTNKGVYGGYQTGRYFHNVQRQTITGYNAGFGNQENFCRDSANMLTINAPADVAGNFLTSAGVATFISAMGLTDGDFIALQIDPTGPVPFNGRPTFEVYNTDSIRMLEFSLPALGTSTFYLFPQCPYSNITLYGAEAIADFPYQAVYGNDSTIQLKVGNYRWNTDQPTAGKNGYVQTYNEANNEIELQEINLPAPDTVVFASMAANNQSDAVSTTLDAWEHFTNATNDLFNTSSSQGVTIAGDKAYINFTSRYLVAFTTSFSGTNVDQFTIGVQINSDTVLGLRAQRDITNNSIGSFSAIYTYPLAAGDTIFPIVKRTAGGDNFLCNQATFNVIAISGIDSVEAVGLNQNLTLTEVSDPVLSLTGSAVTKQLLAGTLIDITGTPTGATFDVDLTEAATVTTLETGDYIMVSDPGDGPEKIIKADAQLQLSLNLGNTNLTNAANRTFDLNGFTLDFGGLTRFSAGDFTGAGNSYYFQVIDNSSNIGLFGSNSEISINTDSILLQTVQTVSMGDVSGAANGTTITIDEPNSNIIAHADSNITLEFDSLFLVPLGSGIRIGAPGLQFGFPTARAAADSSLYVRFADGSFQDMTVAQLRPIFQTGISGDNWSNANLTSDANRFQDFAAFTLDWRGSARFSAGDQAGAGNGYHFRVQDGAEIVGLFSPASEISIATDDILIETAQLLSMGDVSVAGNGTSIVMNDPIGSTVIRSDSARLTADGLSFLTLPVKAPGGPVDTIFYSWKATGKDPDTMSLTRLRSLVATAPGVPDAYKYFEDGTGTIIAASGADTTVYLSKDASVSVEVLTGGAGKKDTINIESNLNSLSIPRAAPTPGATTTLNAAGEYAYKFLVDMTGLATTSIDFTNLPANNTGVAYYTVEFTNLTGDDTIDFTDTGTLDYDGTDIATACPCLIPIGDGRFRIVVEYDTHNQVLLVTSNIAN